MGIRIKAIFFLSYGVLLCFSSLAQDTAKNPNLTSRPILTAHILSVSPMIDGKVIGDSVWDSIEPIETMTQIKPHIGKPASEKTSIRVAYSEKVFYIAVICYDSDPKRIVVSDSRRDADLTDDDSFLFIVDTYNDTQNGFLFGTNADGMEYDAQIDNEGIGNNNTNRQQGGVIGGINLNWDAKWQVKTHKGDYGWSAEFAIPFSSLRFAAGDNQTWGINFERNISKNTETAYWASIPIGFDLKRLSLAGKIHGMKLVNPGNLKVMPYVLAQVSNTVADGKNKTSSGLDGGVDVKYSITPGVTLDLSYNTDFAQVEVDDEQVNLDRFNLFFPEKRPFFLENAGQFTVGTPGEVDLFFSRRIGIGTNGSLVPIIGGARVSGKIGQTNVGMLSMFTDEVVQSGIEKNSFNMLRVNQDFPKNRSSLGAVFVNRTGLGDASDNFNHVYAIDGKWGLGQKAQIFGFVAKSVTPGIESQDHAYKLHYNYNWQKWEFRAGYSEVGEGFNPEVGFLQRSAFRKPEIFGLYRWRPDNLLNLMELRPHISYRGYWDFNGQLITGYLHIDNHWQWRSGFEVHTGINYTTEGVLEDFNLSGVVVEADTYKHKELQLLIMSNQNKAVSFNTQLNIGGYFGGKRVASKTSVKIRIGDKFASSVSLNHNVLDLPNGNLTAYVFGTRLSYSFTPRMFVQSLIQYNNLSKITSVNARFGWLQNANNGLFVVFNIVKDQTFEETLNTESIRVKYTRSFDLMRS